MYDAFNTTFITLISKTDAPKNFNDIKSISLCNCIYKIIAKTMANKIWPILSQHIASAQFTFLDNKHIHEANGVAQEGLQSLKIKKWKPMIMKIDLAKAFYKENWLYICIFLTHLGFNINFIN